MYDSQHRSKTKSKNSWQNLKHNWAIVAKLAERVMKSQKWLTKSKNEWVTERECTRTQKWLTKSKNDRAIIAKMAERAAKSQKMDETHAQAWDAWARTARGQDAWWYCGGGTRTGLRARACEAGGAHEGGRRGRDSGRAGVHASQGGWVGRPARRFVQPLGPGDGPIDPSP
jgi:uncharacterized protein YhaN